MSDRQQILVTGSSKGLGRHIAEHLLGQGHKVLGCARSESTIEHPEYSHYLVDLADEQAINQLFFDIRKAHGYLDALINNAGIAQMNALALTPSSAMKKMIDINYIATFLCSQKAIGLLKKSSNPRIINMSTVAVPLNLDGEAAYAASKSAVETLTKIMAKELSNFSITCNAIGPAPIDTDLIRGVGNEKIQALIKKQAIQKMATADDVTNLVDFFLRKESHMITGQIIYLGGIS